MIKIKICGITLREDLDFLIKQKIDFAGIILVPESKRFVSENELEKLFFQLDKKETQIVGVFQNPSQEYVKKIIDRYPFDLLQFHGNETREFCESFELPYIKTFLWDEGEKIQYYPTPFILLDSGFSSQRGGTGKTLDWQKLPSWVQTFASQKKIFVAGGIQPDNLQNLLTFYQPYAVDMSSGVEAVVRKKDFTKIKQIIKIIRG